MASIPISGTFKVPMVRDALIRDTNFTQIDEVRQVIHLLAKHQKDLDTQEKFKIMYRLLKMREMYNSFLHRKFNTKCMMVKPNTMLPPFDTGTKVDILYVQYDFNDRNSLNLYKLKQPESYEQLSVTINHAEKWGN